MAYPYASTSPKPPSAFEAWRTTNSHSPTATTSTSPTGNTGAGSRLPGYGLSQSPAQGAQSSPRLSPFFNERHTRTLPMYKDKPYFAPRRTGPRSRRRKTVYTGVFLFVVMLLWRYTYGPFSWGGGSARRGVDWAKGRELYEWMVALDNDESHTGSGSGSGTGTGKGSVDWDARREKVRDAMIVSWDGYEQFAWGELCSQTLSTVSCQLSTVTVRQDEGRRKVKAKTRLKQASMNLTRSRNEARIWATRAWAG